MVPHFDGSGIPLHHAVVVVVVVVVAVVVVVVVEVDAKHMPPHVAGQTC